MKIISIKNVSGSLVLTRADVEKSFVNSIGANGGLLLNGTDFNAMGSISSSQCCQCFVLMPGLRMSP